VTSSNEAHPRREGSHPLRWLWLAIALLALAGIGGGGSLLLPGVQTWLVQRALDRHPEWGLAIGRVSLRPGIARLEQVQLALPDRSLELPQVELEMALWPALSGRWQVGHLRAEGWTLDLTSAAAADGELLPTLLASRVLGRLRLPVDLAIDELELNGEIVVPAASGLPPARARVVVQGGGLRAGQESNLEFAMSSQLDPLSPVNAIELEGRLGVTMPTSRTISAITLSADATARGRQFPQGTRLHLTANASHANSGDNYGISLEDGGRPLVQLGIVVPEAPQDLVAGSWYLDVSDGQLAAFTLGRPLPAFTALGYGRFDTNLTFSSLNLGGRADIMGDRLDVIRPSLGALGQVRLVTDFNLGFSGRKWTVRSFSGTLRQDAPVASVRILQPFDFDLGSGLLQVGDPARDLLAFELTGLPLAWLNPVLPEHFRLEGSGLRGSFTLAPLNGGFGLRPVAPLSGSGLRVWRDGEALTEATDLTLRISGDYAVEGWQVTVSDLDLQQDQKTQLVVSGRVGRLAGDGERLRVTGEWSGDAASILRQPLMRGVAEIGPARTTGTFSASLGADGQEWRINGKVNDVAARSGGRESEGFDLEAEVRLDRTQEGRWSWQVPIQLRGPGRNSDLAATGSLRRIGSNREISGSVQGNEVYLEDILDMAGLAAPTSLAEGEAPWWSGHSGQLEVQIGRVHGKGDRELTGLTGRLAFEQGNLQGEVRQASLSGGGDLGGTFQLRYLERGVEPLTLDVAATLNDVDGSSLFGLTGVSPVGNLSGRFSINLELGARGRRIVEALDRLAGDFSLRSTRGNLRLLEVDLTDELEAERSALAATVGLVGSVMGQDRMVDWANRAQIVAGVAGRLASLDFDQLQVEGYRDAGGGLQLSTINLISREARLAGEGRIAPETDRPLADRNLDLSLELFVLGELSRLAERAGLEGDGTPDSFGYVPFASRFRIGGSLADPQTEELAEFLARAARLR